MKHKKGPNLIWADIIILVICIVIPLIPLLKPGFIVSDDGDWMVIRLSSFYQNFREGQFPVRFLGRLNFNYGYPVSNFLYPGFLYIGSVIHLMGLSFVNSVKAIFLFSLVLSILSVYFWLRSKFDRISSLLSAATSGFAPYILFDIYKRGSVGEILAIGVGNLLIFAVSLETNPFLPIIVALLIISHNSIALIYICFTFSYIIFKRKYHLIWQILLGFLISSFFWLPAIMERQYVLFDKVTVSNPFKYFAISHDYKLISWISLVFIIVSLFIRNNKFKHFKQFSLVWFLFLVFLSTPISAPIWKLDLFSRWFQFPYRFLSLQVILGSWFVAYVLDNAPKYKRYLLIIILLLLTSVQAFQILRSVETSVKEEGFYTTNEATTTVANEYLPKWVKVIPQNRPANKIEFVKGRGIIKPNQINSQKIDVNIDVFEESIIQINTIYYPGWGISANDQAQEIDYENDFGVMRFSLNKGQYRILSEFRETLLRFIIDVMSFIVLVGVTVNIIFMRKKKVIL